MLALAQSALDRRKQLLKIDDALSSALLARFGTLRG